MHNTQQLVRGSQSVRELFLENEGAAAAEGRGVRKVWQEKCCPDSSGSLEILVPESGT